MKICVISDTHWTARKSSKYLHDYFELFYKNIFFPTLEKEGISTIVHMGDAFDNRKSIDFWGLNWTKKVVLEPFKKYKVHMIVGNHDIFLRNSNEINSPNLLLQDYKNIKTYSKPTEVNIGGLNIAFIPWICEENKQDTMKLLKSTKANIVMGHLELNGFQAYPGQIMEDGMSTDIFNKFDRVFSGHYHTRSNNGKIFYLGNPYEMYWNDVNDARGFHIFDTETFELTSINNPYRLFYIIYYEDTPYQTFDSRKYENKIVKVIVRKKSKPKDFEKFIDKLHSNGVQELKIIENFTIQENEDFEIDETENTISILNRYIDDADVEYDKSIIKKILQSAYKESCEVE